MKLSEIIVYNYQQILKLLLEKNHQQFFSLQTLFDPVFVRISFKKNYFYSDVIYKINEPIA